MASLDRRALLKRAAAGALALAVPARLGAPEALGGPARLARRRLRPFTTRLPIPKVLTGSDLTLRMREASVSILPGARTRMWTYGGSFPGPTIRRPAGQTTRVTFKHELGPKAGELTVHLHGGHNRASEDGQPGGLTALKSRALYCDISASLPAAKSGNNLLIRPGGERTYTYDLTEDGEPERAAFQFYHDHRLERTAPNIWRGLVGMWILDDEFEASLPLPKGGRDIPLMLAERSFDKRNQLTNPFATPGRPPNDGVKGRHVLVNGEIAPFHNVRPQRYRLRLLNASHFRAYDLQMTDGVRMVQIATESGLMPKPVERRRVLLGPGERVELVVDFAEARGKRVQLLSAARRGERKAPNSEVNPGPLMQFRVSSVGRVDRTEVPPTLRPLPAWVADADEQPSHVWRFSVGGGVRPSWLVNGRTFDPSYAEVSVARGQTVTWELRNETAVSHLIHLHHTDWYMLRRNGAKPPPWERCLKETFYIQPDEWVVIAGHISDYPGMYVIHCHMLDHEDHGMMSQFEVR